MNNLFLLNKIYCRSENKKILNSPKKSLYSFLEKIGISNNLKQIHAYPIKNIKIKELQNIINNKQNEILLLYNILQQYSKDNSKYMINDFNEQIKDFNLLINIFMKSVELT